MISTFTMEAGLVIAALMAVVGVVQWKRQSGRQQQEKYILDYAGQVSELESQKREEFTYYIEDQGLEICACDNPEELTVISKQQPFEIREAGLSRGQGVPTKQAVIKQDVKYYIILESKHEISIKATKRC